LTTTISVDDEQLDEVAPEERSRVEGGEPLDAALALDDQAVTRLEAIGEE